MGQHAVAKRIADRLPAAWRKTLLSLGAVASVALLLQLRRLLRKSVAFRRQLVSPAAVASDVVEGPDPKRMNVTRFLAELKQKDREGNATEVSDASINDVAGQLGKYLSFPDGYQTHFVARPDVAEGELLRVTDWKLLTPADYDRTGFHIEVDIRGTKMEKLANGSEGKALSVYAANDDGRVREFLSRMGIDPLAVVSLAGITASDEDTVTLTTVEKLFTHYLDMFGKPTRNFLKMLSAYAEDIVEKVAIAELTLDRKMDEFLARQGCGITYADYFLEFPSLRVAPVEKFAELVPTIKQRVYSICSSSEYRPGRCQLLVVREDWQTSLGETKFGLCSSFLTFLRSGFLVGHSTHSVMHMPTDKTAPIFMAGLGTGLAPFRAFVEQRKFEKDQGVAVGPMTLFFGGRYSASEYYYRDEFESYEAEGLVKCCNAWSRDQAKKVYVQHKIAEQADSIWLNFGRENSAGYFFLCGSRQPEKDVYAALIAIFMSKGGKSDKEAQLRMDQLQTEGRYVTEVY